MASTTPTFFLLSRTFFGLAFSLLCLQSGYAGEPIVLGEGKNRFEVGKLLASDDFENLDKWIVQVEQKKDSPEAKISANGSLDCFLPNRGATIWFKEKLKPRVTITYDVVCPLPDDPTIKGLSPRDINNFWMASAPAGEDLFDPSKFTGAFPSYHRMKGYYASTGGGSKDSPNRTTRLRRYPREADGKHKYHLFLNHRDGKEDYLVKPGKVMAIQLVAYDDLIQYIVNGELVYEVKKGQLCQIETSKRDGQIITAPARYDLKRFPPYTEGYFGFRMVGTHHIYRNFRVHALQEPQPEEVAVSTLDQLRKAMKGSNQRITMKPGKYVVSDLDNSSSAFILSGSNNLVDLTGVKIEIPISIIRKLRRSRNGHASVFSITGNKNTLNGGTFEDTYPKGVSRITNFGAYNQKSDLHPSSPMVEFSLSGDDITMKGCKITVRGSSPYGYGNIYGIGGGAVVRLRKHSGILTTGDRPVIDGCEVKMETFGHAIFFQGGDDILVQNCKVEGELRRSDDLYKERAKGDLPREFDYQMQWPDSIQGLPIPKNHMLNLSEDGIRAYPGTRHVTVKNCQVHQMRAGVKLYLARSGTISDCTVTDCIVQGYSLPSNGKIIRCSGNAAYGPLLYIHSGSHNSQNIDLTVLPAPHSLGDHPLAAINGQRNTIRFTPASQKKPDIKRPIIVGYPLRFDFLSINYPKVPKGYEKHFAEFAPSSYRADQNTIINETAHPVVIGEQATDNKIESVGKVTDYGRDKQ